MFLNSHLLGEVELTCDRVAFVKRGRVVAERSLAARTDTLELELRATRTGSAILEGLSRFGTHIEQPQPGVITLQTGDAAVPAIVSWLVQQGVQIHAVQPRRKSLEDIFLDVMGEDGRPG